MTQSEGLLAGLVALVARILMSVIFIWSGYAKLTEATGTVAYFGKIGLPQPALALALALAVAVELGGGILLVLGLLTRPVAAVLALWCIATALVAHADFGDRGMMIHFTKNLAMAGGFAFLMLGGAGALSLDAVLGTRKPVPAPA